jgi:hypothetical protein
MSLFQIKYIMTVMDFYKKANPLFTVGGCDPTVSTLGQYGTCYSMMINAACALELVLCT